MSYPSGPPGNSGYPSGPPAAQYAAPGPQYGGQPHEATPAGPSKLPFYLDVAVAVLGLATYATTFALDGGTTIGPIAAVVAGLFAGVGLLPTQTSHRGVIAVLAVLGFLVILADVINIGVSNVDWPSYLLLVVTLVQAAAAVAGLLLEAGIITAPAPKPKYEPSPYGQYGAPSPYYGQPQGQPLHGGPPQQGQPHRGGYPPQQYGGYPSGPSTGGFASQAPQPPQGPPPQSGPPTPPTGFPAFGQPQGSLGSQTTQSFESQQPQQQPAPQTAPPPS